jgi:pimeloyl-ACP methyl ester carboxylesterase
MTTQLHRVLLGSLLAAGGLLSACTATKPAAPAAPSVPLACNDGIKTAFKPDRLTTVVAVKAYQRGDKVYVSDSNAPVTLAADLCMVKLLVGPGNPGPADARSTSSGIGIEVWLPTHAAWNQRIRNYGGGGAVGGNHIHADSFGATLDKAVGSKFPAPIIAGMGYASGTTDAGQRLSQNGSFNFLPDGRLNTTLIRDFSSRSLLEQAVKTRALVQLYYGQTPKYAYFDGHSMGGRQGWKMAQDYPEQYDGYLIAAPAQSTSSFSLSGFYNQIVLKEEFGFTSADPAFAASGFRLKMTEANKRAVAACDKEKLGFLLDPFSCNYDPGKDAAALCTGVVGIGVVGSNADPKTCVNAKEARAISRMWFGPSTDGSVYANETAEQRSGKKLAPKQLWWALTRGADWGGAVSRVSGPEAIALARQDIRYAASQAVNPNGYWINSSTAERDKWREVDLPMLVDTFAKGKANRVLMDNLDSDSADLKKLVSLGRKIVLYTGLAEDVITPTVSINHYERVAATMGGASEVQNFMRMYLVPGKAHSSQGRAYTVAGNNNSVPLPKLPGSANQTPSREQDQMFSTLQDWVEAGKSPGAITLTSRDNTVSYPICVYPQKAVWDTVGSSKLAGSYSCR